MLMCNEFLYAAAITVQIWSGGAALPPDTYSPNRFYIECRSGAVVFNADPATKIVTTEPFVVYVQDYEPLVKVSGKPVLNIAECSLEGETIIHAPMTGGDAVAPGVLLFTTPYVGAESGELLRVTNLDCRMTTGI